MRLIYWLAAFVVVFIVLGMWAKAAAERRIELWRRAFDKAYEK